ncbi:hypothetical protein HAX54_037236, partial [Datura stramonium]|nr:hypothetical protein [Datura stramonium]
MFECMKGHLQERSDMCPHLLTFLIHKGYWLKGEGARNCWARALHSEKNAGLGLHDTVL